MLNLDPITHSQMKVCLTHIHSIVPRETVVVWGEPGLGKTMAFRELARSLGMAFTVVHLNQMSMGEMKGMQFPDTKTRTSVQYPPDFLPQGDDPPTLILFDELGTCPELLRKAALELLLERRIGRYRLREGDWCVGASNTGEDGVQTFEFDPATADRFTHFLLRPSLEDWVVWAKGAGIDGRVIAFLESHSDEFAASLGSSDRKDDTIVPTPRSWSILSRLIHGVEDVAPLQAIVAGRVGARSGARFMEYCRNAVGHVAAGRLLALPPERRLQAMPRKAAGLQSLAWSLPAHAVQSPRTARDCLHIACLMAQVQPEDGPGSRGFSKEAAANASHLVIERIGQAMPEALEGEISLTGEFQEAAELLRIPGTPPKGAEDADSAGRKGGKAAKGGAKAKGKAKSKAKGPRPKDPEGVEDAKAALDAALGGGAPNGDARAEA